LLTARGMPGLYDKCNAPEAADDTLVFHLLKENTGDFFLFNAEIERVLKTYQ